jgi:hypothetical protein
MELKLDAEALQSVAATAIFQSIDADQRDTILQQAIRGLLVPDKNGYGTLGQTPLQKAFDNAIASASYQVVRERIADDPRVSEAISELLGPMINSALNAEAENYDQTLATAIGAAVGNWLAEVARERRQ